jgi:hypothetical protein
VFTSGWPSAMGWPLACTASRTSRGERNERATSRGPRHLGRFGLPTHEGRTSSPGSPCGGPRSRHGHTEQKRPICGTLLRSRPIVVTGEGGESS